MSKNKTFGRPLQGRQAEAVKISSMLKEVAQFVAGELPRILGFLHYRFIYQGSAALRLICVSDIREFPALIKYYLFFSKELPEFGKYNPGQKFLYNAWAVLVFLQAGTGFMLYFPDNLAGLTRMFV